VSNRKLAVCIVALSTVAAGSASLAATPFDGRWSVALHCPSAPDGAKPFSWQFSGVVKDGVLAAEHGVLGRPAYLSVHGSIEPSGKANLVAEGVTGTAGYNINAVGAGVPYRFDVLAQFEAKTGSGYWMTTRRCDFTFFR
jgi:hypothetical protein